MKLTRRALARGLAATAVALPALEALSDGETRAQSRAIPKRFVLMYAGVSTGTDASREPTLTPRTTGANYQLGRGLLPLGSGPTAYGAPGHDVQADVSFVSGLKIPWADRGGPVPPGGRSREFHYNTVGPQISGMRGRAQRDGAANGPSADQIAADLLAGDRPHRSLSYRVQAARYVGDNSTDGGQISYRRTASGELRAVDPIGSPRLAYRSLFSGFEPPDPALAEAQNRALRSRRGVLALTQERTRRLAARLGAADRERLERHYAELNALETRLAAIRPPDMARCVVPAEPVDPPIGRPHDVSSATGNLVYVASAGYSNEQLRGETFVDLVHMAFACDLSRVAAIRLTHDQSFLNVREPTGVMSDAHETTHGAGGVTGAQDMLAWHVWHFARLVRKLRDTRELDGTSTLDHTALVLLFEGGIGYDPEGDSNDRAHSTENMVALIAGHVGGLIGGQHVVARDAHPAQVLVSALSALGVAESLGEIQGGIPGLLA